LPKDSEVICMVSAGRFHVRRRNAALSLAALVLLLGIVSLLTLGGTAPAAHADGPTLFLSTGVTNPGGEVDISGTGWSPAQHYNLYVYGQVKCKPNPICPPPANAKAINFSPIRINSNGNLGVFSFVFVGTASITTYVFTVVADYPTDMPFSASALVQVVPAGTPTATGTVSSGPTTSPTVAQPTQAAASPTAQSQNPGTGPGTTTSGNQPGFFSNKTNVLIVIVTILLLLMITVLAILLRTLPARRRAIRAAYYGEEADEQYAAVPRSQGARRRSTGGYPPVRDEDMPWQGGVASWDDATRASRGRGVASWDDETQQPRRGSMGNPYSPPPQPGRSTPRPPPPRRPSGREWE
jgi:hypothetical protein